MTLEQLKTMSDNLVQAINDYKQEKDFDELGLEGIIDGVLCKLPRDMIYVEWYDRSDIQNVADGVFDEPVNDDLVDVCMHNLWEYYDNIMNSEVVQDIVCDSVKQHYKGEQNETQN